MWKLGCLSGPVLIPGPALLWLWPQYKTDLVPPPCCDRHFLFDLPAGKRWSAGCFHTHTLTFEPKSVFRSIQSLESIVNTIPLPIRRLHILFQPHPCLLLSLHTNTNIYTGLHLSLPLLSQFWLYHLHSKLGIFTVPSYPNFLLF